MMPSVSTPESCTVIVGLTSSPTRISPTLAAQVRHRVSTSWASRPGIGVRIVPWFRAASFSAFRPRSDSTSGTSADKSNVLISRSSLRKAARLGSS